MLVERTSELASLRGALRSARSGHGRLVLLAGEAGVGKSALVRAFADELRGSRVGWGVCDPSLTPPPLTALADIAAAWGGPLQDHLLEGADRTVVFRAFLEELGSSSTVAIIEDAHWADEATLDVIRYIGRRITSRAAVVMVTYRDDETGPDHPLRQVLGDLATAEGLVRLRLAPLSKAAVGQMAVEHGLDGDRLFRQTGGNPFFVTEVIGSGSVGVPDTVRDAVLARAARLPPAARAVLEAAAIAPTRVELRLLTELSDSATSAIDTCVEAGVLVAGEAGTVAFRHELARRALEEALPPARRAGLHARAAAALADSPDPDSARVAYHAAAAALGSLAREHAVRAAGQARRLGARREAAAQFAVALRFADGTPAADRAALLEGYAECTSSVDEGLRAAMEAVELRRSEGDPLLLGSSLRTLSQAQWAAGRSREAEHTERQAIEVLEPLGPTPELANAYASASAYDMLARDLPGTLEWGRRAVALAEETAASWALARSLNALGSIKLLNELPDGRDDIERSIRVADAAGLPSMVSLGWSNLGSAAGEVRDYATAEPALREAITTAADQDVDTREHYATAWLARILFEQGRWTEAESTASSLPIERPGTSPIVSITALAVLGRLAARRGDPSAERLLERAWRLAKATGDLQRTWPVAAARAELAWLHGHREAIPSLVDDTLAAAVEHEHRWAMGELALLRRRADPGWTAPQGVAEPFALHLDGRFADAAAAWRSVGCPYEAADALADAGEEGHLREALATFDELGAAPAAAAVRRRLRAMGVRGIPRGRRRSTTANPARLTAREAQVLELVARGLPDAGIAEELFISRKTVGHHVSAVLRKLGAASRGEAGEIARRRGLLDQPGDRQDGT